MAHRKPTRFDVAGGAWGGTGLLISFEVDTPSLTRESSANHFKSCRFLFERFGLPGIGTHRLIGTNGVLSFRSRTPRQIE